MLLNQKRGPPDLIPKKPYVGGEKAQVCKKACPRNGDRTLEKERKTCNCSGKKKSAKGKKTD